METLTPEQAAQISLIVEKWQAIALSTEPIDRHKAASAIKSAYTLIGKEAPEIVFCSSPRDALNKPFLNHLDLLVDKIEQQIVTKLVNQTGIIAALKKQQRRLILDYLYQIYSNDIEILYINYRELCIQLENNFGYVLGQYLSERSIRINLVYPLDNRLINELQIQAKQQITSKIAKLESQLGERLWHSLKSQLERHILINNNYYAGELGDNCCWVDICTSVFSCTVNQSVREVLELLGKECGQIYAYEKICFVCDRPTKISLDNQNRLHAEGEPAFQLADGYSVYAHHGSLLPEKYGKLPPERWYSGWILKQKNAELRRLLIQIIGYERISRELKATELDTWREYTLLKIDKKVDNAFIYLLKMTCPSTGHIHVLRVPPDMQSAREAIRWVNWGIDPEEFSVQT